MVAQEYYFLSSGKYKPELFGIPLLITYNQNSTGQGNTYLVYLSLYFNFLQKRQEILDY